MNDKQIKIKMDALYKVFLMLDQIIDMNSKETLMSVLYRLPVSKFNGPLLKSWDEARRALGFTVTIES